MATNDENTMYGLDVYDDWECDVAAQRVHEDISSYRDERTYVSYDSSSGARRKSKTLATLSSIQRVATRSLSIQQTAQLTKACSLKCGETVNVRFGVGEKLIIMFMYNNTYAVYRKSDRAVAVLTNAQFQGNPPAMLDGSKFGNLLSEVEFVLMYAVAKVDHCNVRGLKFYQNDVILILAECRDTFVGITPRKRVGIFPSNLVHTISKRRKCIFKGMVLKMTTTSNTFLEDNYDNSTLHNDSTVYEITKSSKGLFSWIEEDGREVSLHGLVEKSSITEKLQQDDGIYEVIHEISFCGTTLQQKKKMPLPQPGGEEDAFSQGDSSLQGESWFHGNLSRNEAERLLTKDGDFLVRFMSNYPWVYVLSCKTENGYEHFRLRLNNGSYYHTNGGYFRSIRTLIQVHQSEGKPVSKEPSTIIRRAVKRTICENSSLEEDISQGNDNEISKEEEEQELVNSDEQVSTIQQSCEYNTSFGASFANNHEELPRISEYQEVPPRTAHMKEFYPDLERLNTKQECDCQRGKEANFEERDLWKDGEDHVKDHSVKGLVNVFNSYDSKHSHEDHYSVNKNSRGRGVTEEEVPSTEAENESKDGKHECRFDNDSKSLVLEMKEIREEVESVKSLMKSFMKMSSESIKQDKFSSKSVNHSENVESTDEKTYTDTVVEIDKELHVVDFSPEETYTDTVVENDKELHVVDLSPEEQEDAQRRLHLKQDLHLHWHMEINDQLRDIVAAYLEPEFFHDVGKKLGVHKNRRTQIELEKTDIVERTYELLGQWHQKQGHMATIGKLIECLEPFDPEDFTTILEELCEELGDNYSRFT